MDRNVEKKERNRKDKYRSSHKRERKKIFYGKRKQELEELNKEPETQEEQLQDTAVLSDDDIDDGDSVSKDDGDSVRHR